MAVVTTYAKAVKYSQVDAGQTHSVLRARGEVSAWGENAEGQLGDGSYDDQSTMSPGPDITDGTLIDSGFYHTLCLRSDGTVWAWGRNNYGQLGDGSNLERNTPVRAGGLTSIVAISAGFQTSFAVGSDGTVWGWGDNRYGQIGDGTQENRNTPQITVGIDGVTAVSAGVYHALALKSDGTVWAWGKNQYGQLGDGGNQDSRAPVQVSELTDVLVVSAGACSSLALKSDGTVWAWGQNSTGQLGDGTTSHRATPVRVQMGDGRAIAIAGGHDFSLALKANGSVWAWGDNSKGQLGTDIPYLGDIAPLPVGVSGISDVVSISAGVYHSLASKSDGSVWGWGYNNDGQLGDGTESLQYYPVRALCSGVTITAQPQDQTVAPGDKASMSVTVSGVGPLRYRWYRIVSESEAIPVGTNSSTLNTPPLSVSTSFYVETSDKCGNIARSETATATVTQ